MDYATGQLSLAEEEMLRRAERSLEALSSKYQHIIRDQVEDLSALINHEKWQDAAHIAHQIGGEAGTFSYARAGEAAMVLRDFLSAPSPGVATDVIRVAQETVALLVQDTVDAHEAERLVTALKVAAQKTAPEAAR
jgi:HPt (histidine-containing phosphotransfer) domain-containing protein